MLVRPAHQIMGEPPRPSGPAAAPVQPVPVRLLVEFNATAMMARIQKSARTEFRNGAHELTFQALGTQCRISFVAPPQFASVFSVSALTWVANFEAKYSRYWPESLVSRINAAAGRDWTVLDAEADRIFALCHELHFLTRGSFDPTALPLLKLWDWKQPRTTLPTEAEIAAAKSLVGWYQVKRAPGKILLPKPGMSLDLGGMGKEFAVDQVAQLAHAQGCTSALVDFGADVRVFGLPPDGRPAWHIGLDDPRQPGKPWTGLAVREAAVATSGDYLRKFELNGVRIGHIMDVRAGRPVANGVRSVSVLAPSCTQAGMLSTAVFVLGPDEGMKLLDATMGVAGAIVLDNKTIVSRRFHEYATS
ncbi:MAG TPA: FAD:protein FMN transferase [Candidatus Limnocylindria bacterium]|nr:FAD:protein FMN transferase [Candidatus Limnocylindria bacterium]